MQRSIRHRRRTRGRTFFFLSRAFSTRRPNLDGAAAGALNVKLDTSRRRGSTACPIRNTFMCVMRAHPCVIVMGGNKLSEMNRYIDSLFCTSHSTPRKHTRPEGFHDGVRHGVILWRTRSHNCKLFSDFLFCRESWGEKCFPTGGKRESFDRGYRYLSKWHVQLILICNNQWN